MAQFSASEAKFTTKYHEIAKSRWSLRGVARHIALDLLSNIRGADYEEIMRRPRIQFLYIHHVFQDEKKELETLVGRLSKEYTFIGYTEAVDKVINGNIDRPYLVFSSDDGLHNNLDAAEVLDHFGIKACFFICPSIIGEPDYKKVSVFCNQRLHFPPVRFLEWADVEELMSRGHEIGAHTMNHIRISEVDEKIATEEILRCREVLLERVGQCSHFAYPYGKFSDFPTSLRSVVFDAGYSSCASAERGCHVSENAINIRDLLIRRDHILLDWPIQHIQYFLYRNAKNASTAGNGFHS